MFTKRLLFILAMVHIVVATIDLTLPELEHLANHLTKEECHKLVAALHFDSFKLNHAVENAENAVPEDMSCLKLLLHWNSGPGEGLGETHERLSLRLRQIGRLDLASWLDSAVLTELEQEMNGVAQEFQENTTSGTPGYEENSNSADLEFNPIQGAVPHLVLFDDSDKELTRIDLTDLSRSKCNSLARRWFSLKPEFETGSKEQSREEL